MSHRKRMVRLRYSNVSSNSINKIVMSLTLQTKKKLMFSFPMYIHTNTYSRVPIQTFVLEHVNTVPICVFVDVYNNNVFSF